MRYLLCLSILFAAAATACAGDLIPTDPRYGPLRVASHKVEATVDNQIATTRVEQVFANDNPVQLEAHYVFPVPKGATIIDFSMTVDGKLIRGELLEKQRAREIYEGIVRQSKDPGLLEHVGANIFRVRVFPVLPNSSQKMELTYVERVNYDAGQCTYAYPLRAPGSTGSTKTDRFDLRWRLKSAVPIKDVASATHRVNVSRKTEDAAEVSCEGNQVDLSKDIEIAYRITRPASGMDLVAYRPSGEEGTFLLLVTPEANPPRIPKDMTFVLDTSGSMEGHRIRQARAALKFCLSKLAPDDRFNILTFSNEVKSFEPAHVAATEEARARAVRFVDAIDATGGTNINDALLRALDLKAEASRPHLILFLTDGQPTVGVTDASSIVRGVLAANRAHVRIFTFGVGADLNKGLLEDLADGTRAVSEYVAEEENIEEKVSRLQRKIATPVISDLSIDWGQAEVSAVHPKALGDLFAGTQLMVTGRYTKAGTFEVVLKGRAGDTPVEVRQKIVLPERRDESAAVPYLWAMRKVATLLDEIRRSGENAEVVQEVVALARKYRLATPYTSFLVLESEQSYDQHGVDRRSSAWTPPTQTAKGTGKVLVPGRDAFERKGVPADDPVIFFPEAKTSDHNESADDKDYGRMAGDSKDLLSYTIGGGGERYGRAHGGRVASPVPVEKAVLEAPPERDTRPPAAPVSSEPPPRKAEAHEEKARRASRCGSVGIDLLAPLGLLLLARRRVKKTG